MTKPHVARLQRQVGIHLGFLETAQRLPRQRAAVEGLHPKLLLHGKVRKWESRVSDVEVLCGDQCIDDMSGGRYPLVSTKHGGHR